MPPTISLTQALAQPNAKPTRTLAQGPGWRILLVDLRNGGELPTHSAPGAITVHCLEGHADFAVKGELTPLHAGDLLCVEAHVPHAVKAPGGAVLLVHLTLNVPANAP